MRSAETGKRKSETGKARFETRHSRACGNPVRLAFLFAVALLLSQPASAQVATGFPPFASFGGGPFDVVNNANLNVHFAIPVVEKAGRGLRFDYLLSYDSSVWTPTGSSGAQTWTPAGQQASSIAGTWGWRGFYEAYAGYNTYTSTNRFCVIGGTYYYWTVYSNFTYHDSTGTSHSFNITTNLASTQCGISPVTSGTAIATDGSGLTMSVTNYTSAVVYTRSGDTIQPPVSVSLPSSSHTDSNGNRVTGTFGSFADTLNTTYPSGGHRRCRLAMATDLRRMIRKAT